MKRFRVYIFFTIPLNFFLQSCTYDSSDSCTLQRSYQNDIRPLVLNKCAISGCHVAGFVPGDFTLYQPLKDKANSGTLKMLVVDIKTMPPDASISLNQRNMVKCWIEQGALNN